MSDRDVRIYEVGPRDGLQNEAAPIPTAAKLRFIALLADAGVREIEAMKMEHTIGAAGDGTVAEILVEVGRQVDIDQVIAVITTGDESEEAAADGAVPSGGGGPASG